MRFQDMSAIFLLKYIWGGGQVGGGWVGGFFFFSSLLLLVTPNSLPGWRGFRWGSWQRREVERKRKGEKKCCHGARPLPKVLNL